jgi:thiol-disulfide isomerase/thioredoxin/outer membrane lipoprotein-sorting protein
MTLIANALLRAVMAVMLLAVILPAASFAQPQAAKQPDAATLLRQVADAYAHTRYFHIEAISEDTSGNELQHSWRKNYLTAISAPGNRFRIETRSGFGSYIQVSDGKTETIYAVERGKYVERPAAPDGPVISSVGVDNLEEIGKAWRMPQSLEATVGRAKDAILLPGEALNIGGVPFDCYVVRVQQRDKDDSMDQTLWIEKHTLAVRKSITHRKSHFISMADKEPTAAIDFDTTTVFPVVDLAAHDPDSTFAYNPPATAKKIARLEPDLPLLSPGPAATMVGQMAPDAVLTSSNGTNTTLASLKGRPVLLDFWATWCPPCLSALPQLGSLYAQIHARMQDKVQDEGLRIVSIDEDQDQQTAAGYMARHGYTWTNYHDQNGLQQLFKGTGIPLVVLIDAQGRIVYYDFGGKDEQLRAAIAGLGPEYASLATPHP